MRLLAVILAMLLCQAEGASTYYVDPSGDGSDGLSLSTAYKTLGAAISPAHDGDTILITSGIYNRPTYLRLTNNVTWRAVGGSIVVTQICDGNFSLYAGAGTYDGWIFQDTTNGWGVIGIYNGTAIFTNVIVRRNVTANNGAGGGVVIYYGSATGIFFNCEFRDNQSGNGYAGGAVWIDDNGCFGKFYNCIFSNNIAPGGGDGGAIYCDSGAGAVIVGCVFEWNVARRGSAINANLGTRGVVISNSIFRYNYATEQCTIMKHSVAFNTLLYGNRSTYQVCGQSVVFENSTMLFNYSSAANEGCFYAGSGNNNIIWGNYPYDLTGTDSFTNSLYGKKYGTPSLTGCLTNAPQFVGGFTDVPSATNSGTNFVPSALSDIELQSGSPCVDTGTNQAWMVGALDLAGDARIYNTFVDMGAYEYSAGAPPAETSQQHWRGVTVQ